MAGGEEKAVVQRSTAQYISFWKAGQVKRGNISFPKEHKMVANRLGKFMKALCKKIGRQSPGNYSFCCSLKGSMSEYAFTE